MLQGCFSMETPLVGVQARLRSTVDILSALKYIATLVVTGTCFNADGKLGVPSPGRGCELHFGWVEA